MAKFRQPGSEMTTRERDERDAALAYAEFRYGGRGRPTHKPQPGPQTANIGSARTCQAVDPVTGRKCGRWINFVQTTDEYYAGKRGSARHNPRPYGRHG